MNLQSFFTLASLGEKIGVDLWNHRTGDGRSIVKALDYLVAFADPSTTQRWPYQQITEWAPSQIVPLLYQAACHFPDKGYKTIATQLEGSKANLNAFLYPCAEDTRERKRK